MYSPPPGRPVSSPPSSEVGDWMTYREIAEAANLATPEAARARASRAGWPKRVKSGTDSMEVLVPPGGIVSRVRRYRKVDEAELRDILALRAAGKGIEEIAAIKDRSTAVISYCIKRQPAAPAVAVALPAKPVRMPGESSNKFGGRVTAWKMAHDPEFRKECIAKTKRGMRSYHRRKRNAAAKAAKAQLAPVVKPATDIAPAMVVAPPPPSLWQRIMGWFR